MNWNDLPAAENSPGQGGGPGVEGNSSFGHPLRTGTALTGGLPEIRPVEISIGKAIAMSGVASGGGALEVYTLTLGTETIELLPLKNWHQLDHHKWTVQGKLPAPPAGLEVTAEHVRVMGGTVALTDPAGCRKLEQLFNEWLRFERETLALARQKARPPAAPPPLETPARPGAEAVRFQVEVDKRGQVHIHCLQGKEPLASVGLSVAGINSLHQQGLMRKPRIVSAGALHDWIELDGELCSFERGRNDATRLEQILNERYRPDAAAAHGKQILIFLNAASATGFDIQFPVRVAGVAASHRHHLNEQMLDSLQDPDHCGLLHKEIVVKLIPPNLVFKRKTPDGGEQYLAWTPENTVQVTDEEGRVKTLHLSQPLNLLRLSAAELTAVFNHPAINRHTVLAPQPAPASEPEPRAAPAPAWTPPPSHEQTPHASAAAGAAEPGSSPPAFAGPPKAGPAPPAAVSLVRPGSLPNLWLKSVLAEPALPPDWFSVLTYTRMAERFGNSNEGKFGPSECWFITVGESDDIADPAFRGIFITEKGSLGFLGEGQMARFYNGMAFLGTQASALEGIHVSLVGVGLDAQARVVFVLSDNYRGQFGVSEATLAEVLGRLREGGAVILGIRELLANADPIEILWTAPAQQADPSTPVARESIRPQPA